MNDSYKKNQLKILDFTEINNKNNSQNKKPNQDVFVSGDFLDVEKFKNYNLNIYIQDINELGLEKTWHYINNFLLNYNNSNKFLNLENLAELYETGLALENKHKKKASGQYYTPNDVANVMAHWFQKLKGKNICDVACGTGRLILSYLDIIGKASAINLIKNGRLYLYDVDETALSICKTIILKKYGLELSNYINDIHCDFLSKNILLPKDCKVISNPPYSTVGSMSTNWENSIISLKTKELYAMFIEKIIKQSDSSVIISPYSFIGGKKFYPLRKLMNNYNGFIVSFDNVPGSIFCGKKHGIFNTNTSNSVRAAITVVENKDRCKGFMLTPLIRFKNEEREKLLNNVVLESFINSEYQIADEQNSLYCKCSKEFKQIWKTWKSQSTKKLQDYISKKGKNIISMPNTCRYYTTAAKGLLNRRGQIVLSVEDKNVFNYLYCLINSSFVYLYWRLFDGGITYPKGLLLSVPVFYDKLTASDKEFFNNIANEMINIKKNYTVNKKNIGVQENIKYPRKFRDKINRKILDILGLDTNEKIFDSIHSNMALEVSVK